MHAQTLTHMSSKQYLDYWVDHTCTAIIENDVSNFDGFGTDSIQRFIRWSIVHDAHGLLERIMKYYRVPVELTLKEQLAFLQIIEI